MGYAVGSFALRVELERMVDVLVVDDNKEMAQLLVRVLKASGFSADSVADGKTALAYIAENRVRLVILDYMMPDLDGLQVLKRLRARPQTAQLPVIFYTASDDPTACDAAIAAGVDECWIKANTELATIRTGVARYVRGATHDEPPGHPPRPGAVVRRSS